MSIARRAASHAATCTVLAVLVAAILASLPAGRAWARSAPGGIAASAPKPSAVPVGEAELLAGRAIPPAEAPAAVRQVIAAANRIRTRPYVWGGGHGRWWDRGYDCSGAVSYALHGGRLIDSPLPSGPMTHWGSPGPGRWITVYANAGHAYAVIAGLRWDTAGNSSESGPRWHTDMASTSGFVARHPEGY